jgi:hypothetical protein
MSQSSPNLPAPAGGDFLLYQTEDGRTRIEVRFEGETVWLSLNQLADLFQRDKSVVSKHIKNVFDERELLPQSTVAKFATVQKEGNREHFPRFCHLPSSRRWAAEGRLCAGPARFENW